MCDWNVLYAVFTATRGDSTEAARTVHQCAFFLGEGRVIIVLWVEWMSGETRPFAALRGRRWGRR